MRSGGCLAILCTGILVNICCSQLGARGLSLIVILYSYLLNIVMFGSYQILRTLIFFDTECITTNANSNWDLYKINKVNNLYEFCFLTVATTILQSFAILQICSAAAGITYVYSCSTTCSNIAAAIQLPHISHPIRA